MNEGYEVKYLDAHGGEGVLADGGALDGGLEAQDGLLLLALQEELPRVHVVGRHLGVGLHEREHGREARDARDQHLHHAPRRRQPSHERTQRAHMTAHAHGFECVRL